MRSVVNFNAGPAGLPESVIQKAQSELLDYQGTGMSIMEHSHRGKAYDAVHMGALSRLRSLLTVPDSHAVFFVQGGASGMFASVPMNFLPPGQSADYLVTGTWAKKAMQEAGRWSKARNAGSGEVDGRFCRMPTEYDFDTDAAYVHLTSNNTVAGTQWSEFPQVDRPMVVDASSDILSRGVDWSRVQLLYAGAQKNLGPSGVTLGIVDKAWLDQASTEIPAILRYKTHVDKDSLFHTPPTFSIYLMGLVLEWIEEQGGLQAVEKRNEQKAQNLYAAIDGSDGFYSSPVEKEARSRMNVVWRLPSEDLEQKFVADSVEAGFSGLKGHRSVGGIRASIYNAVEPAGVEKLVDFMGEFRRKNG